jgi:membrane associated rhomboid family serine protease
MQQRVMVRYPMGPAVKAILIANGALFLATLILGYATGFSTEGERWVTRWFALTPGAVTSGFVWQPLTYMWLHSADDVLHIVFNMLMLWIFGTVLEQRWGTRGFVKRYLLFGVAGAVLGLVSHFALNGLFGWHRLPAVGASGAVAGLAASFAIMHWRTPMQFLFGFVLTGRGLLLLLLAIDVLSVLMARGVAVEVHWGGMLAAFALTRPDLVDPVTIRLRIRRWRLKRRLRLKR